MERLLEAARKKRLAKKRYRLTRNRNHNIRSASPNAISSAIDYAKFRSRSHDAVIRVYNEAGNVIETHEHTGDFREF
jgi:hypothetical protein